MDRKDADSSSFLEKWLTVLVCALLLVQGGFFPEMYLLAGISLSCILFFDNREFAANRKIILGLSTLCAVVLLSQIIHGAKLQDLLPVGYIVCFILLYVVFSQNKDAFIRGVFYGVLGMELLGMLGYLGMPLEGMVKNNRFMGSFQYANVTAMVLVFTIFCGMKYGSLFIQRFTLLHYVFLFLTFSVGGIGCFLIANCYIIKRAGARQHLLSGFLRLTVSVMLAGLVYIMAFVAKNPFGVLLIWGLGVVLSWNWEFIMAKGQRIMENSVIQAVTLFLVILAGILCGGEIIKSRAAATFQERIWQMEDGLRALRENPWFGIGPGNWKKQLFEWRTHDYEVSLIHNSYLHIGVESGIFALFILAAITVYLVIEGRKHKRMEQGLLYAAILHALMDIDFFFMGYLAVLTVLSGSIVTAEEPLSVRRETWKICCKKIAMGIIWLFFFITWVFYLKNR